MRSMKGLNSALKMFSVRRQIACMLMSQGFLNAPHSHAQMQKTCSAVLLSNLGERGEPDILSKLRLGFFACVTDKKLYFKHASERL